MLTRNHFLRNKSLPEVTFRRSPDTNKSDLVESFHSHNLYSSSNLKLEADKSNFYSQGQVQKKSTLSSLLAGSLPNYDSVKVQKGSIKLGDLSGNIFSTRNPNQVSARQKSEKKIERTRDKAREVTFNRWEKIFELREILSIYQANECSPVFPNRKHVQKILECLESLNSEENELGDLMMLVIKVLNTTTYIDWHFSEVIIKSLQNIESKELLKALQNSFHEKIPYYTLSRVMLEELMKKESNMKEKEKQHKREIEGFRALISQKENEIQQVHAKYKQTILIEEYNKVIQERNDCETLYRELDIKHTDLKQEKKDLETAINEMKKEKENFIEEIKYVANKLTECQEDHESTKQSLNQQTLLNVEECQRIKKYKKLIDATIIKISDFKQQITNLKHCNNELFLQNKKLNVRAAAGFVNLTPRPDYSKNRRQKGNLSLAEKFEKKSTIQIFEELIQIAATATASQNSIEDGPDESNKAKRTKKSPRKLISRENNNEIKAKQDPPENENKPDGETTRKLTVFKKNRSLSARPRDSINFIGFLKETDSLNNLIRNVPVKVAKLDDLDLLKTARITQNSSFLELKPSKAGGDSQQQFESGMTKTSSINQSLSNDIYEDSINLANKMMNKLIAAKKGF